MYFTAGEDNVSFEIGCSIVSARTGSNDAADSIVCFTLSLLAGDGGSVSHAIENEFGRYDILVIIIVSCSNATNVNCSTEQLTNNNTLDGGRFQHHTATLNEPFHEILEARTQSEERGYKYKYKYT